MSIRTEDRGETLLEILISVVILGITGVAILSGLMTTVTVSDMHRKQATAGAVAQDYAETVSRYVAADHYVECATAAAYAPGVVGFTPPGGYTASIAGVEYWNAATTTFSGTCSSSGLERVTVQVASTDGRATEDVVVVVRRPCGGGSSC